MPFTTGLRRAAPLKPSGIATVFGSRQRSYAELERRVARLANTMRLLGIGPGNSVALAADNSDRVLESMLGLSWSGAVITPLNVRWSIDDLIKILNDSESVALFIDDRLAAQVDALLDGCQYLRALIYIGEGSCPEFAKDYETLIAGSAPMADASRADSELFGLFYASSDAPGVMLSYNNVSAAALALMTEGVFVDEPVALHLEPMSDLSALLMTTAMLLCGGTQVIVPALDLCAAAVAIEQHAVSDLLLKTETLKALSQLPPADSGALKSLRRLVYREGQIDPALADRLSRQLPAAVLFGLYGPLESAGATAVLPPSRHVGTSLREAAAGRNVFQVESRVLDAQDRLLPRGQSGELIVRGPTVMLGYLNRPEETRRALRQGWLRTGTAARMDEQGYLTVDGRIETRQAAVPEAVS